MERFLNPDNFNFESLKGWRQIFNTNYTVEIWHTVVSISEFTIQIGNPEKFNFRHT